MNSEDLSWPARPTARARWARSCGAAALALACVVPGAWAQLGAAPLAPATVTATPVQAEKPAEKPRLPELKLSIPADVQSVTLVGRWVHNKESGPYRVIVIRSDGETVLTRVVVQWLRVKAGEMPTVVASQEVEGFSEYAELAMVPTWRELGTNRLQLMAEIRTAEGQFKRVRLLATTPGVMTDPS